jgi:Domain of Unknown Function with PDB structure (DUF3857)
MKRLFLYIAVLFSSFSFAQTLEPESSRYHWSDEPKLYQPSEAEKNKPALIVKDKRIVELFFDRVPTGDEVNTYYTRHVIVWLNSDNAIEEYNKVYISMSGVTQLVSLEARTISKDGKVKNMNKSAVKDVDNYDNNGAYKIFALEGVEIGGVVEYIYTLKKPFRIFGTESYRSNYDYKKIEFRLLSPDHLLYEAKGYNGLSSPVEADNGRGRNAMELEAENLAGFETEVYASDNGSYPRIEYKLAFNKASGKKKRLYTWDDAADSYLGAVANATSDENRMCAVLYQRMNVSKMDGEEARIRKIESYLKTHFTVRDDAVGDQYEKIAGIIKTGVGTELGIMRLYYAVYVQADIKSEIVLTSNRFDKGFDGDFESWTYLQHFLIYFPSTEGYIAPSEDGARYGFVPGAWAGQDGLFIKEVTLGGARSASGNVKKIGMAKWEESINRMDASLKFDLDNRMTQVHMKHSYTGYSAAFIQPYYLYLSSQDRREYSESIIKGEATDAKPKNLSVTGYNSEDTLYRLPFSIEADYATNSLIEFACGKYIFKVGEVIGPQFQMYQTQQERRSDMILANPHGFKRFIKFEIPAGYKATNLESLNMDIFYEENGERTMDFKSSYTVDGNIVTVTVEESYRKVSYPKSQYEDFRKVINASADFNKVVVYFEKITGS